jgi:hypothetical protein
VPKYRSNMRNGRIFTVACCAAIGLAACGGGSSKPGASPASPATTTPTTKRAPKGTTVPAPTPRAALLRAVTSTEAAKTAKMSMTITASGLGIPLDITASGALDFGTGNGQLTMETGGAGGTSVEERIVNRVAYVRTPATSWQSLDLKSAGLNASSLSQSQSDPSQYLSYLAGVSDDVKVVGHESVRGTATTKYHATIDLGRALQRDDIPATLREKLTAVAPGFATAKMTTDVWIDAEGRARKMTMTIPFADVLAGSSLASAIPAGASESVTLELYDFGTPVHVEAPPANEVTPLEKPPGD